MSSQHANAAGDRSGPSTTVGKRPHPILVHGAMILTQTLFGGGAIVGKFGIHGTNPVLFALIREGIAGPFLCLVACLTRPWSEVRPKIGDLGAYLLAGLGLFANQLCFILAVKITDPVIGSAWQPSQPVFTLLLAVLLGYEVLTLRRAIGILLAVSGAVFMAVFGAAVDMGSGMNALIANFLLFLNCLGTCVYVIVSKGLLTKYPAIAVIGWSYLLASLMMLAMAIAASRVPEFLSFICQDPDPAVKSKCLDNVWSVPTGMLLPLAYWICFCSIWAYFAMTWCNKYLRASLVSVYTVLQPCTSCLISSLLVLTHSASWAKEYNLELPGWNDVGIIGIVAGLAVLFLEPTPKPRTPLLSEAEGADCTA